VIDAHDMDGPGGIVDAINDSLDPAASGVMALKIASQRLANAMRAIQKRPVQELSDCGCDRPRQGSRRPFDQDAAGGGRK
jgi:hypothetical protein